MSDMPTIPYKGKWRFRSKHWGTVYEREMALQRKNWLGFWVSKARRLYDYSGYGRMTDAQAAQECLDRYNASLKTYQTLTWEKK